MFKITMLAIAAAAVVAPVFAQEGTMTLGEGEALLISPNGNVHKSSTKVSDTKHESALARGAKEISRGTVFYRHGGKLYGMSCAGPDIGGWEQGYPGTENMC
jgi:hypothetical protein